MVEIWEGSVMSIEKPQEAIDLINRSLLAKKLGMTEEAIALIKLALDKFSSWEQQNSRFLSESLSEKGLTEFYVRYYFIITGTGRDLVTLNNSFNEENNNDWIAIADKYQGEKIND